MLRVTWEWIGLDEPALDVANTVGVEKEIEHDLLAPEGEYARWAEAAAKSPALATAAAETLPTARERVLRLRGPIRELLAATAAGERPPAAAVDRMNGASRASRVWLELDAEGDVRERAEGSPEDQLLAAYARSAIAIASGGSARLRICAAPSCGMFYRPSRKDQRWCSEPCGTRARVARHYRRRHAPRRS